MQLSTYKRVLLLLPLGLGNNQILGGSTIEGEKAGILLFAERKNIQLGEDDFLQKEWLW